MDNASKALIMAGAILLAVMLVSLGVILYNRAKDQVDTASGTFDSLGVQSFNAQFEPYIGTKVKPSSVRSLITAVITSNASSPNQVTLNGVTDPSSVSNNQTYTVTATYDTTTAYITAIDIQ